MPRTLESLATGNPWLDAVLAAVCRAPCGISTIQGHPGAGKTYLSLRLAIGSALHTDTPSVYIAPQVRPRQITEHYLDSFTFLSGAIRILAYDTFTHLLSELHAIEGASLVIIGGQDVLGSGLLRFQENTFLQKCGMVVLDDAFVSIGENATFEILTRIQNHCVIGGATMKGLRTLVVRECDYSIPDNSLEEFVIDLRVKPTPDGMGRRIRTGSVVKSQNVEFPSTPSQWSIQSLFNASPQLTPPNSLIEVVSALNAALMARLKASPHEMHQLSPRVFEEFVAELLASFGWRVTLTARTRDGGYDIFGIVKDISGFESHWIVECKKYRPDRKVGIGIARELYAVKGETRASNALIATTSSFTKGVHDFGQSHYDLKLSDFKNIVAWLGRYQSLPSGTLFMSEEYQK